MRFQLVFKTPDVLDQIKDEGWGDKELKEAERFTNQFVKYGEYVTLLFDTEEETVVVEKRR